jgi:hypothetical protein
MALFDRILHEHWVSVSADKRLVKLLWTNSKQKRIVARRCERRVSELMIYDPVCFLSRTHCAIVVLSGGYCFFILTFFFKTGLCSRNAAAGENALA